MNLYYKPMMNSLRHIIKKSKFFTDEEKKEIMKGKVLKDFDDIVTSKNMGLNNVKEYYELLELEPKIYKIKVPTLFFLAKMILFLLLIGFRWKK